ncbi:ParB/RepB/Spo0J family partition protein [Streptomyces sp. NPDC059373]
MSPEEMGINQQPVVEVDLGLLTLADSPRLSGVSPEHVETLAAAQTQLPPITVHRATMRVIDGFHRLKAARLRGEDKVAVRFFDGDEAEAFVLAVTLNVAHGLPLALADRKCAAERIIVSHPQWSDRRVASVTGISPGTVAEIRRRIIRKPQSGDSRVGQDGRVRPIDGSAGRRLAGELLTQNPGLSLRQVARAAAISPETVRDVRNRLRNGEDLLPAQRKKESVISDGNVLARRREFGVLELAKPSPGGHRKVPVRDRAAVVKRLKADPALRLTESGRNLLRLLTLHTLRKEEWDAIINSVPLHCRDVVADLARQFADLWRDFATQVEEDIAQIG